jgi:hypothetical protein
MGVMHDLQLSPELGAVLRELPLDAKSLQGADLLRWCQSHRLIPEAAISVAAFSSAVWRYKKHFQLLRDHRPGTVHAPIVAWWSGASSPGSYWSKYTKGEVRERVVGGTHFTVIQPPHIEVIAAELRSMLGCNRIERKPEE